MLRCADDSDACTMVFMQHQWLQGTTCNSDTASMILGFRMGDAASNIPSGHIEDISLHWQNNVIALPQKQERLSAGGLHGRPSAGGSEQGQKGGSMEGRGWGWGEGWKDGRRAGRKRFHLKSSKRTVDILSQI